MTERDDRLAAPPGAGDGRPTPAMAPSIRDVFLRKTWQVLKVGQARLRFFAILAVIGVVIGYWDTIAAYYAKWTRPLSGQQEAAASDVEYYCPMHPFIVRDDPKEKCPICHMDLARRKKGTGEAEPLPPGTVSRVQLSPYRVVLAGVQTMEVSPLPLSKEVTTFGTVEFNETKQATISARQKARVVKLFVNYTGQMVEKDEKLAVLDTRYSPELTVTLDDLKRAKQRGDHDAEDMALQRLKLWDVGQEQIDEYLHTGKVGTEMTVTSPIRGHVVKKYQREGDFVDAGTPLYDVADLHDVWIEAEVYEADQSLLREGLAARATTLGLPNQVFEGTLDFVFPHLDEATRTLTVRFTMPNHEHRLRPGMYATVKIDVPPWLMDPAAEAAAREWAERSAADGLAHALAAPAGPAPGAGLAPQLYAMLHENLVLAVPDSAVIDTGSMKVVYREASPNTFEGVAVRMGPRMAMKGDATAYYPVLSGLAAGDRVVTNGSFLIDAETRLNPSAGSIYFGGTSGTTAASAVAVRPSTPESDADKDLKVRAELAKLSAEDRKLAQSQGYCPVLTANRLGSMGLPFKVMLAGQPVFLCCPNCEENARAEPDKTLSRLQELKAAQGAGPHGHD